MSLITGVIPAQGFELIRDRIGAILFDEIQNQGVVGGDVFLTSVKVFSERSNSFDKTELPAINVCVAGGNYGNKQQGNSDGTYTYNVDVFCNAKTSDGEAGDEKAAVRMERLLGICRYILEDPLYKTLGFAPPFIGNTHCVEINIAAAGKDDADTTRMGRLTFSVRCAETNSLIVPVLIGSYVTHVILSEGQGYVWEGVS